MFNGTSTQDRSICANCGRVKPTQLAKDGQERQCIILNTLHTVTQFTIKHSSYKNATTGYLIVWLTCLNITLAPSPIPSRITHSLFGIMISLGGMQFCVMPRTLYDSSHLAHSTMPWQKSEYCQIFFPCTGSGQQYAHRQETIDTTVLSPHGVDLLKKRYALTRNETWFIKKVE